MSEKYSDWNLKYKLETLASYDPADIDDPVFEVCYESDDGADGFIDVCCVRLAREALDRIEELEELLNKKSN